MRRLLLRLRSALRPERDESQLEREIASHLALLEDEHRRRGLSDEQARLAARRAMGSVALAKDLHRDERSFVWLDDLRRDLRRSVRGLRRNPGFTAAVVLTLALGIGANTAIFSVVNAVLVRPLPYPDADRLVYLYEDFSSADGTGAPIRNAAMDVPTVAEFRTHTRALSDVGVQESITMTMAHGAEVMRLRGSRLSPALLSMLDAKPFLGRLLEARDEVADNDAVVLLSHAAWQRYFGGSPAVVGQPVILDGRAHTVVGVMQRDFFYYANPQSEFWTPFVLSTAIGQTRPVVARLNDGMSTAAAQAEITTILRRLRGLPADGRKGSDSTFSVVGLQDQMVAPVKPALLVLAIAVGFVLIIACVNVANLVLARLMTREREIAIRGALGASAGRIARLFLAESMLLAVTGCIAGIALAVGGIRLLHVLGTTLPRQDIGTVVSIPRLNEVAVDGAALVFATAVSLVTSLIFGLAPSLTRRWSETADALRSATTAVHSGMDVLRRHRLRGLLVVVEVAAAMTLLIGAGLMVTSFARLVGMDPGYDSTGVVTFQTALPDGRDVAAFAEELVARLQSIDGVRVAAYGSGPPMNRGRGQFALRMTPDRPPPGTRVPPERTADPQYVSRDYLEAMGIKILEGRGFTDADRAGSPQVMLINQSLARSGLVGPNPLGTRVYALFREPWEIIGIVEDTRQRGLDQEPIPQFFIDLRQVPGYPLAERGPYFAVRTAGDITPLLANLRAVVRQIEPQATVDNVATMDQVVWDSVSRPRLYAVLLGIFAVVAITLAAIGIFGLMAYLVEQRAREIGIRMALGARRPQVVLSVLGQSVALVLIGVGIGLGAAAGLTRYLEGLLFGLTPLDPPTFGAASLLFIIVALVASYVPARRATGVDPLVALRAE